MLSLWAHNITNNDCKSFFRPTTNTYNFTKLNNFLCFFWICFFQQNNRNVQFVSFSHLQLFCASSHITHTSSLNTRWRCQNMLKQTQEFIRNEMNWYLLGRPSYIGKSSVLVTCFSFSGPLISAAARRPPIKCTKYDISRNNFYYVRHLAHPSPN